MTPFSVPDLPGLKTTIAAKMITKTAFHSRDARETSLERFGLSQRQSAASS